MGIRSSTHTASAKTVGAPRAGTSTACNEIACTGSWVNAKSEWNGQRAVAEDAGRPGVRHVAVSARALRCDRPEVLAQAHLFLTADGLVAEQEQVASIERFEQFADDVAGHGFVHIEAAHLDPEGSGQVDDVDAHGVVLRRGARGGCRA